MPQYLAEMRQQLRRTTIRGTICSTIHPPFCSFHRIKDSIHAFFVVFLERLWYSFHRPKQEKDIHKNWRKRMRHTLDKKGKDHEPFPSSTWE